MNKHWFKHDSTALSDERIMELRMQFGWEGYGLFWAILETLFNAKGYWSFDKLRHLSFLLNTDKDLIERFVNECLTIGLFSLSEDGKEFYSERMLDAVEALKKREKAGEKAGHASGESRRKNAKLKEMNEPLNEPLNDLLTDDERIAEQRREEKRKEENNKMIQFESFWNQYPRKHGKARAMEIWSKLGDDNRKKAIDAIKLYDKSVKDKSFLMQGDTFLSKKKWVDFEDLHNKISQQENRV